MTAMFFSPAMTARVLTFDAFENLIDPTLPKAWQVNGVSGQA